MRGVVVVGATTTDSVSYAADRKSGLRVVEVKESGALREVGGYETTGLVDGVVVIQDDDGETLAFIIDPLQAQWRSSQREIQAKRKWATTGCAHFRPGSSPWRQWPLV